MKLYDTSNDYDIDSTADGLASLANESGESAQATFNDVLLTANPGDSAETISEYFRAECQRRHEEYLRSPQGIADKQRQAEYDQRAEDSRRQGILPFSISDPEKWQSYLDNNQDGYGSACVRYAARWASFMEKAISHGASLESVADSLSHEADTEGITGFMYGASVGMLSLCWKHGDQLRRWHNLKTQIRNEGELANENGGVLNPAMLVIGSKSEGAA